MLEKLLRVGVPSPLPVTPSSIRPGASPRAISGKSALVGGLGPQVGPSRSTPGR